MVYLYPMSTLFSVEQVTPKIFHLHFADPFELTAHFLRFQEFYESPRFSERHFDILTFVKWYARQNKGDFTYFNDWTGFNIPAEIVRRCMLGVSDPNPYDHFMVAISKWCETQAGGRAYLIGTSDRSPKSIWHEVAHGLWYTNSSYQVEQHQNLGEFCVRCPIVSEKLKGKLREYHDPNMVDDEVQAYLATGLEGRFGVKLTSKERRPFVQTFEKYYSKK